MTKKSKKKKPGAPKEMGGGTASSKKTKAQEDKVKEALKKIRESNADSQGEEWNESD